MAVKADEKDTPLGKKISELLAGWHKDGTLLAAREEVGPASSPWLAAEHEKYKSGRATSSRAQLGEGAAVETFFRHLYETTGINFSIFYDRRDELRFLRGFGVSFELMGITLLGSLAIGVAGAWLGGSRSRVVRCACVATSRSCATRRRSFSSISSSLRSAACCRSSGRMDGRYRY